MDSHELAEHLLSRPSFDVSDYTSVSSLMVVVENKAGERPDQGPQFHPYPDDDEPERTKPDSSTAQQTEGGS
jgi:hypothetical protein